MSGTTRGRVGPGRQPPPHHGASLLDQLAAESLEHGYQAAARRRAAGPLRPRRARILIAGGMPVLGLLLATTVVHMRAGVTADARQLPGLLAQVERRTAYADSLQARVRDLRADVTRAREEALRVTARGTLAGERLRQLELAAAVTPVRGPGLRVTVDDAPGGERPLSDEDEPDPELHRILDVDLQRVVNGMWAAGAEAVAVGGQRLTALSAIRSAGAAVLVDYRPVSPPYVVSAVGDPVLLEPRFVDGAASRELRTLESVYGIRYEVAPQAELLLPGASGVTLRYARPAEDLR